MRPTWLLIVLLTACGHEKDDTGGGEEGPRYATSFTEVSLAPDATAPVALAVQACAGLDNRALGGSVYVASDANDEGWLTALALTPAETVSGEDYLARCLAAYPCVRYDYAGQHAILPPILTAAAVLGAVPMDASVPGTCGEVALDASEALAGLDTPEAATRWVFERYGAETTGLAMLNPGFDPNASDRANPPLTYDMSGDTVDLVFARRLFALFLVNGCVEGESERDLLDEIVNAGTWDTPLGVYGYNDSWLVGGYLYEAQTRCLDSRNMGAIPSKTGNLSFFSTRRPPIVEGEVEPNDPGEVAYDPGTTYVAFVIGDGDNLDYILTRRNAWIQERLATCSAGSCAPLTWSISPHLPSIAPDVLEWYYAMAAETGQDGFVLPPSGHLYAYPSSLDEDERSEFAAATEADARVLGIHGTVHWEWLDSWEVAMDDYLPRYGDVVQGIVPVNVPYNLDAFPDWPADKMYEVIDGRVVVFRPREWRGVDGGDEFTPTPEQMAADLEAAAPGTVTAIYMTSDGGLDLSNSVVPLAGLLPDNVQLVTVDVAARLAMEAG